MTPRRRPMAAARVAATLVASALLPIALPAVHASPAGASLPAFSLPTENHRIHHHDAPGFYQYVDRTVDGEATEAWEGGCFGFCRSPLRIGGQMVMTRFHEGIDIRPLRRDETGAPLDPVRPIAPGKVVHTAPVASHSNYGIYVVVEHPTPDGPLYSLYAHLRNIAVSPGQAVTTADTLGILGWTGVGLDQRRAHLHLELCLLLNSHFDAWHQATQGSVNRHGAYNGLNLVGIDVIGAMQLQQRNPKATLAEAVRLCPPAWKAVIPVTVRFELPTRYPWLATNLPPDSKAAEITFSRHGLPLEITSADASDPGPRLSWMAPTDLPITLFTNRRATRNQGVDKLTPAGIAFLQLIGGNFPDPAPATGAPGETAR